MAATPFSSFIRSWWLVVGQRVFWGVVGETGILSRGLCFEERGFRGLPGAHLDFGPKTIVDSEEGGVRWKKQSSMSCCSSSRNLSFINHPLPPPWFPTPLGLASITSESSITGQKSPAAWKWLKCTHVSMFIRHTHLHVLQSPHSCHPACFWHKHSPPHLQHTHSVCVCHQSGGLKTTNSRSLQGREGAATEVLICCCYRVCVGQVTSLPLFSDNRSFTQQWHYAPSTAIHRLLGKTRIPAVVDKHKSTHAQALWNTPIPATQGMHTNILTCTYTSSGCSICRHLSTTHMHLS